MSETSDPFWMVLAEGHTYTRYRHGSMLLARDEASRLARENPGIKFHVLECIGHAVRENPVKWVDATPDLDAEIPF